MKEDIVKNKWINKNRKKTQIQKKLYLKIIKEDKIKSILKRDK